MTPRNPPRRGPCLPPGSHIVTRTAEPPHPALIEALAADVNALRQERGITFEQAYDAIAKPDWVHRYSSNRIDLENQVINKAKSIGRARSHLREGHRVADFSTLPELVKHARSMDGATHIAGHGSETRIYFPRGDGQYEEATVWQRGNYWHALGPGARQLVRRLPQGAKPLTGREMRWASEKSGTEKNEHELIASGRCPWQTATGMPGTSRCGHRVRPGHLYCPEHEQDWRDLYPHQPIPMTANGRAVRDYAAIDNHGRTTAGPFKTYGDAKTAAGAAGLVKYVPGKRASEARRSAHHAPNRSRRPR